MVFGLHWNASFAVDIDIVVEAAAAAVVVVETFDTVENYQADHRHDTVDWYPS